MLRIYYRKRRTCLDNTAISKETTASRLARVLFTEQSVLSVYRKEKKDE
jgi:hypothetical protein